MSRPIIRQDVIDCAESGWTITETAEELGVKYHRLYRYAKKENLLSLFRHGNRKVQKLQKSDIDMAPR